MREILFRGKRIDDDQWIYGWLTSQHQRGAGGCTISHIQSNTFGVGEHQVSTQTIGQYTGFVDKKKRKIFEGDIYQFCNDEGEKSLYAVERHTNKGSNDCLYFAGWYVTEISNSKCLIDSSDCLCNAFIDSAVFVGNVFDNAELVEEK